MATTGSRGLSNMVWVGRIWVGGGGAGGWEGGDCHSLNVFWCDLHGV